jgi:hypothetical protein
MRTRLLLVVGVLGMALGSTLAAQGSLSAQVLQLLTRINTWTAKNTFLDLRLQAGTPSDTALRFYVDNAGNLYFNGGLVAGAGGGVTPHNLLSTTHTDTLAASVTRGAVLVGNSTPAWSRLTIGAAGRFLRSDGTDAAWSTDGSALTALPAANLTGTAAAISGVNITSLNASNLGSGTVPLARLSGITFTQWGSSGCAANNAPVYDGANWVCSGVGTGNGTVTSVGLSAPAMFTVAGTPVTGTGTLALTLAAQTANTVFAGPTGGGAAAPTFRALVNADFPLTGVAAGTYAKVTLNTAGIATAAATDIDLTTDVAATILPMANGGTGVAVSADDTLLVGSGTAWVARTLPDCPTGALGYTQATNLLNCTSSGGPTHALLSATHTDTLAASPPTRGSLIAANASPVWAEVPVGTIGQLLTTNGVDPSWGSTIARGSVTTSQPWIWTQTWNDGAVTFTGVRVNITNTASAAASLLQDWQVGGTSKLAVRKDGTLMQGAVQTLGMGTPTITAGFGTAPAIAGKDSAFRITQGNPVGATGTVTFGTAFTTAPACVGLDETTTGGNPLKLTATTTTVAVASGGTMVAADTLVIICVGY